MYKLCVVASNANNYSHQMQHFKNA